MVKLVKESLNEDNEMDSVFGDDYKQHYTFGTTNPKYTPRKLSTGENAEDIKKIMNLELIKTKHHIFLSQCIIL